MTQWSEAVGIVVVVILAGGLFTFGNTAVDYFVGAFAVGGLAYGLVGMTIIGLRWVLLPRRATPSAPDLVNTVHAFETGPQRFSLALNVLLLVIFLVGALDILFAGFPTLSLWLGGILQVGALVLIGTNILSAYGRRFIIGEHEAMTHRIGRYRLIRANRVLSYVVWASGTAFAGILLYRGLIGDVALGF